MEKPSAKNMKKFIRKEKRLASAFYQFVFKGNFMETMVSVVIATAFANLIKSLLDNILMPFVSFLLGSFDLSDYTVTLFAQAGTGGLQIQLGLFLQNCLDFLVLAVLIFIIFRIFKRVQRKRDIEEPVPEDIALLKEIREMLISQQKNKESGV